MANIGHAYMNSKVENQPSKLDTLKWLVAGILTVAGIFGNNYFSAQPIALRLAGWLILGCVIVLIVFQTAIGRRIWAFAQDARMELRKVVWPTRQETIQTTLLVIAMVAVTALLLWAIDSFLLWLVGYLTGQRG